MTSETEAAESTSGKKNAERKTLCRPRGSREPTRMASHSAIPSCSETAMITNRIVLRNATRTVASAAMSPKLCSPAQVGELMMSQLKNASTNEATIGTSVNSARPPTVGIRNSQTSRRSERFSWPDSTRWGCGSELSGSAEETVDAAGMVVMASHLQSRGEVAVQRGQRLLGVAGDCLVDVLD